MDRSQCEEALNGEKNFDRLLLCRSGRVRKLYYNITGTETSITAATSAIAEHLVLVQMMPLLRMLRLVSLKMPALFNCSSSTPHHTT